MLDQNETREDLRTGFPADRKPYTEDYDYDGDSDLEENDVQDPPGINNSGVELQKGESDQPDSGMLVGNHEGDESSDIVSVSDADPLASGSVSTRTEAEVTGTPSPTHIGTVVVIEDVAFITYVYFLLPCYGLSDSVRQVSGATTLFVYKRDRVCAMGICKKTKSTRS